MSDAKELVDISGLWTQTGVQSWKPTELSIEPSYLKQFAETGESNVAELFHENTKYKHDEYSLALAQSQALFSGDPNFKFLQAALRPDYPKKELIELPEPGELDASVGSVLANRRSRRQMSGEDLDLEQLGTLLGNACGVTAAGEVEIPYGGESVTTEQTLRAYPSGGGLYPVETYLLVMQEGEQLDPGVYYYVPELHGLRVLRRDPELPDRTDELFVETGSELDASETGVTFVMTAQFWRAMAKYGPRGYRNILQESGHLAQNISLVAEAMELAHVPVAAYRDDEVNEYLGVDGVDEAVIYSVYVGGRDDSS